MSAHVFAIQHVEETIKKEGRARFSAVGFSMLPLIPPGQMIEAVKCRLSELRPGDIVLAKKRDFFILHRLHSISQNGDFLTKGDNKTHYDAPLKYESIAGKIVSVGENACAKILWRIGNRMAVLFLIQIPQWHKRLAERGWYKALNRFKNKILGKKALISPWIRRISSLPSRLAAFQQRIKAKSNFFKLMLLFPKTYFLEIGPDGPLDKIFALWNKSFQDLYFESQDALKYNLFSHPLADNPLCLVAERKGRCLGFLSAVQKFPNAWGETIGSLEAIAVDPDSRRRGVATLLLEILKDKCRIQKIRQLQTCRNRLFFPGLQPTQHELCVQFLIKNGFGSPVFLEEMALFPDSYKHLPPVKKVEAYCAATGFSVVLVGPENRESFLSFLKEEDVESYHRHIQPKYPWDGTDARLGGILAATCHNAVVGCGRYNLLKTTKGPAFIYRRMEVQKLKADLGKSYVCSHLLLKKNLRGRGLGGKLLGGCLSYILLNFSPDVLISDTTLTKFHRRFGYTKINHHLVLTLSLKN